MIKSASLVRFIMYFWQGLNKNGSFLIRKWIAGMLRQNILDPQMHSET